LEIWDGHCTDYVFALQALSFQKMIKYPNGGRHTGSTSWDGDEVPNPRDQGALL
jgi:hypothetical protein